MSAPARPYIVTRRIPECSDPKHDEISFRWAYATLEEVRDEVGGRLRAAYPAGGQFTQPANHVFALPDGSEIVVKATTLAELAYALDRSDQDAHAIRGDWGEWLEANRERILAAWNAEHGIGIGEQA